VGAYYERVTSSTFAKSICAPVSQATGQPFVSAAYCRVRIG